ncbi:MAG: hypothetical protein ACTSXC_00010 [Candidatus Freyarchaeota archaeon]
MPASERADAPTTPPDAPSRRRLKPSPDDRQSPLTRLKVFPAFSRSTRVQIPRRVDPLPPGLTGFTPVSLEGVGRNTAAEAAQQPLRGWAIGWWRPCRGLNFSLHIVRAGV